MKDAPHPIAAPDLRALDRAALMAIAGGALAECACVQKKVGLNPVGEQALAAYRAAPADTAIDVAAQKVAVRKPPARA